MTEDDSKEQYIKCSRCKCKYINDDEHIKVDLGYTRLGVRYKNCVKCRGVFFKHYYDNQEQKQECSKKCYEEHREA